MNKERLIEYLHVEWLKKWEARLGRPVELTTEIFGPGIPPGQKKLFHKMYADAYMEGAADLLEVILAFDEEIRGAEAMLAVLKKTLPGES